VKDRKPKNVSCAVVSKRDARSKGKGAGGGVSGSQGLWIIMLRQAPRGTAHSQKVWLASGAKKGRARAIPPGMGHRGHGTREAQG